MNKNDQKAIIQNIRAQYTEKENTALDTLKALDAKVKRPARVLACTLGSVSALITGTGMSLVMTDIGAVFGIADPMVPGIAVGIAGLLLAAVTWPIYKAILKSRQKKYSTQILELSEKLLQE